VRQAYHDLRLDEIDVDDLEDAGATPGGCRFTRVYVVIEDKCTNNMRIFVDHI